MAVSNDKIADSSTRKWLTIVGLGEDGVNGLTVAARQAIAKAEYIFGGKRHLALAQSLFTGKAQAWPQPFDPSMAAILERRGQNVCVLASGDPMLYGVGVTLARVVDPRETRVIPAPSSFALGAARLGWSLHETQTLSLHASPVETLRRYLQPHRRILALTSGSSSPVEIATYITQLGFGASTLTILETLGGPNERITEHGAQHFAMEDIAALNIVAIEVTPDSSATRVIPCAPGIPDDWFQHDGQITRQEIRALTIAALAPKPGERLWDIGAGAGSIAIEWLLCDCEMQAIAVERDPARAARIRANALNLGVPSLETIEVEAPDALADLPAPDAIFVGGGGTRRGVMDGAIASLRPGGRLVANAVTVEMEHVLMALSENLGGGLRRLALSKVEPLGAMTAWRPALPITQWSWIKPAASGQSSVGQSLVEQSSGHQPTRSSS